MQDKHPAFATLSVGKHSGKLGAVDMQLFLGDTNRTISETPMNQASSRSHCLFTIHIEARQVKLLVSG